MRVYAICRQCAEVHLASAGCPGCARAVAIGRRGVPAGPPPWRDGPGDAHAARGETALVEQPPHRRRVWLSAAVLSAYLIAILGLLAAVLLGQATAI